MVKEAYLESGWERREGKRDGGWRRGELRFPTFPFIAKCIFLYVIDHSCMFVSNNSTLWVVSKLAPLTVFSLRIGHIYTCSVIETLHPDMLIQRVLIFFFQQTVN